MSRHPGEILHQDFLQPLHLTGAELSRGLGCSRSTISRLLDGGSRLTPVMAAKLSAFFGVPAKWWLQMQLAWDLHLIEQVPVHEIEPLKLGESMLLTPKGVLDLSGELPESSQPVSLSLHGLGAPQGLQEPRQVRQVVYDNGAVALVGGEP